MRLNGIFYHGGESDVLRGLTVGEVIDYETNTLGNVHDTVIKTLAALSVRSKSAHRHLIWVTDDKRYARQFGRVETIILLNAVILMIDGYGGMLIYSWEKL